MLRHYVELLGYFWKHIVASAIATGLISFWLSSLLLSAMPMYVASVTLNLQPSEEALMFNSGFMGVTQFNPATIIAQTQIERVLSRPVAERAIDILLEESGGSLPAEPPTVFDRLRASFWRNWNLLNYGYYVPPTEREQLVSEIMGATGIELVEGSYLMLVEVWHENPDIAARAANALIEAYIEQIQVDFSADAVVVEETIAAARESKSAQLSDLLLQKRELERESGASGTVSERNMLLAARGEARQGLNQTKKAAESLKEKIEDISGGQSGTEAAPVENATGLEVGQLREELAAAVSREQELATSLASIEQRLGTLDASESELAAVDLRIREVEADLSELQVRRNNIELAREARLSQVQIINAARPPVYPLFPKVLVNTIIGTILGAILATAPILVLDILDGRIRTSEDLRRTAGPHALPPVTRRLTRQVRRNLADGGSPGRELRDFAEATARAIVTVGHRRWPERRIMVTAFGSDADIERLKEAVEAVVRLSAPESIEGNQIEVVVLPRITQVNDWKLLRYDLIVIGVRAGDVMDDEVKRVANMEGRGTAETLLTVVV